MSKLLTEVEFYKIHVGDINTATAISRSSQGNYKIAKIANFKNYLNGLSTTSYLNDVDISTITDETLTITGEKLLAKTITNSDNIYGYLSISRQSETENIFFLADIISSIESVDYNWLPGDINPTKYSYINDVCKPFSSNQEKCDILVSYNNCLNGGLQCVTGTEAFEIGGGHKIVINGKQNAKIGNEYYLYGYKQTNDVIYFKITQNLNEILDQTQINRYNEINRTNYTRLWEETFTVKSYDDDMSILTIVPTNFTITFDANYPDPNGTFTEIKTIEFPANANIYTTDKTYKGLTDSSADIGEEAWILEPTATISSVLINPDTVNNIKYLNYGDTLSESATCLGKITLYEYNQTPITLLNQ